MRPVVLALTLILASVPCFSQGGGEVKRSQNLQNNKNELKGDPRDLLAIPLPLPVQVVKSAAEEAKDDERDAKSDQHDAADLDAQIRSADSSEMQVKIGMLSMVLSAVATLLLLQSLAETRKSSKAAIQGAEAAAKSVDISERELFISQRAYVFPTDFKLMPVYDSNGAVKEHFFELKWENSGNTPALDVIVGASISVIPKDASREPIFDDPDPQRYGAIMGPRTTTFMNNITIPLDVSLKAYEEKVSIYVHARAEYKDVFHGDITHHSEYCAKLRIVERPDLVLPRGETHMEMHIYGQLNSCN